MMKYMPFMILGLGGTGAVWLALPSFVAPAPTTAAYTATPQPVPESGIEQDANLTVEVATLFGAVESPGQDTTAAPPPDMRLTGVLLAGDPEVSQAFIETSKGRRVYWIGDVVADGFAVSAITAVQVTVTDGTRTHQLRFDDAAVGGAPLSNINATAEKPHQTAAHRALSAKLKKPETTEEHIVYWQERIRRNPGEVLQEIGLIPVDGGYQISRQQNIGVRLAGFRAGDLITSVNGLPVGIADQDRKNIADILGAGVAQIAFERNGELRTLSFPLR